MSLGERKNYIATGSASGKFILLGEHFIVHGDSSAIAFPIPDINCTVEITSNPIMQFDANYIGVKTASENADQIKGYMNRAFHIVGDILRLNLRSHALRISSTANFPIARGFGSSAAFSVALSRALIDYRMHVDPIPELTDTNADLERAAFAVESLFHGKPSGVDTSVILAGQAIHFTNQQLKKISNPFSNTIIDFILVDSGERSSSASLIQKINQFKRDNFSKWTTFALEVESNIQSTMSIFSKKRNPLELKPLIDSTHKILTELGLTTNAANEVILLATNSGAITGKISGAGGGGAVVILTEPEKTSAVIKSLRDSNVKIISTIKRDET